MKLARDIMSLSTFKRDSNKVMRQMKKTKEPVVLTVNGKAAVVVQDADSYQNYFSLRSGRRLSRSCVSASRHEVVRKDDQRKTFSMSSSPRITFQSKIDEKVQGHPPFRCRVGHRIILQMGLSSVGRRKRETMGAETPARY